MGFDSQVAEFEAFAADVTDVLERLATDLEQFQAKYPDNAAAQAVVLTLGVPAREVTGALGRTIDVVVGLSALRSIFEAFA